MRTAGCATSTRMRDELKDRPGGPNMRGHSEPDNMEVHQVCKTEQTEPRSLGKQAASTSPKVREGVDLGQDLGQPESQSGPEYPAAASDARASFAGRTSHWKQLRETPARTNRSSRSCSSPEQENRSASQTGREEPTGITRGQGVRRTRRTLPRRCRTRFADRRNKRR